MQKTQGLTLTKDFNKGTMNMASLKIKQETLVFEDHKNKSFDLPQWRRTKNEIRLVKIQKLP